jgi:transposase
MTTPGRFVGIDVAKRQLDIAERPGGERWAMGNDGAGIAALLERLSGAGPIALIVLEATGGYEIPVVAALTAVGLPVVVVNARQVRDFARAVGKLAKTDAIDAAILAQFAEAVRPERRALPDELTQTLQSWPRSSGWRSRYGGSAPRSSSTSSGCAAKCGTSTRSCRA